jgi:ribose 5-phosphate isomerase A
MLYALAERLRDGRLRDIVGVATSSTTENLARQLGIPLATLEQQPVLDLALDGADEIDPQLNLIKGLGGALLREKIVASSAKRFIVIGSASKQVPHLGVNVPLPVEVVAFGLPLCIRRLRELGSEPVLRVDAHNQPFRTDEGHVIVDCRFEQIENPGELATAIKAIPGVVEHGLFLGLATMAIMANDAGVQELQAQ